MPHDWDGLERIFSEALELPPDERLSFAKAQCGVDPWLLHEVETLLAVPESKADQAFNPRTGILRELLTALDTEFTVGREIGGYRVESLISSGGMGIVYRAVDVSTGEAVALKLLPPEDSENPQRIRRLEREALALGTLDHPGIVKIREYRPQTGCHFIVMELVEGETLQARLAAGPIALGLALDWGAQIAEAMEAAHQGGVAHRDLKPSNIMINSATGRLKLLDFGLARLADPDRGTGAPAHSPTTVDGTIAGTFSYFSPEQANGGSGDERSDIFSFGTVLYEVIAGRRAFERSGPAATAAAVLTERPDPLPAHVPQAVKALLERCLEKDPARRVASMRKVLEEIERLRDLERRGLLKPPTSRKTVRTITATVTLVAAIGTGWFFWHRKPAIQPPMSIAVLPFTDANGDKSNQYFVDGLTEEVTGELSHLKNLRVAPHASSALFRKMPRNLREIGRTLKVTHLLEGGVDRAGDHVKIVASLERTSDGVKLWTNTYQRRTADLNVIEADVEAGIVASLGMTLSPPKPKHFPAEQAHEAYLKARYEDNQSNPAANARAQQQYRRAIELDPDYAAAYAGLGAAIWNRNIVSGEHPVMAERRQSQQLLQKAIQLDPDISTARALLGNYAMQYDWDWNRAEREFQAAKSLKAVGSEFNFAILYLVLGRQRESDEYLQRARDLDPAGLVTAGNAGLIFAVEGRFAEAREEYAKIAGKNPVWQIGFDEADARLGNAGHAIESLRKLSRLPLAGFALARIEAQAGHREEALRIIRPLEQNYQDGHVLMYHLSRVYADLGDEPNTVKWLERSMDAREGGALYIHVDPAFSKMQNTPEFHRLKKRMNLDW